MSTTKKKWLAFPLDAGKLQFPGPQLKKHWTRLHRGDCEPFPEAEPVRDAWRAYHRGDFQQAWEQGRKLGPDGYAAACKAAAAYASYLERDRKRAAAILEEAAGLCEQAREALPERANSHYLLAYCLGRYAQKVSVGQALAGGLASRVKQALDQALELEPRHAEAHVATGTYHAEVIGKVGGLLGGLTYGASEAEALKHYRKALSLFPESAIVHLEYARGLHMMDGSSEDEARKLLARAAKCKPADAAESLDVEHAKERLEALEE
jgi:tetratricopeptide (TPR) repeat protein